MKEWPEDLRPRLSDGVRVRLHRTSRDFAETRVVLHTDAGELAIIDGRAWRLLSCCDGTRDLEGIRRAAAARGTRTSLAHLRAFLGQLHTAGCVEDGPLLPPEPPTEKSLPSRPVVGLPGFALRCHGRGSCCRFFATMTFRPEEVVRARALAPEVNDAGAHPWEGFSPSCGSVSAPWRASAVATEGGRCAYLEGDGGCRLHRRGGAEAKPLGCRVFPAVVVDTGQEWRVGPRPECACVFRSAQTAGPTEPLMTAPFDPGVVVDALPDTIASGRGNWARARYRDWAATAEDLAAGEALRWLESEARRLGAEVAEAEVILETLLADASRRSDEGLIGSVLRSIGDDERVEAAREDFYVRSVAFAHRWAFDGRPLGDALARRAAVLRLARRMRRFDDPAGDVPLALTEALARRIGFIG